MESGDGIAYREKDLGIWQEVTWEGAFERVRAFSLGLVSLGLEKGDRVGIIGDNRPEWLIAELAAQAVGAVPVGLYQDSVASELAHVLGAAEVRIVVAEDQEQVDKILEVRSSLPSLRSVIYYEPKGLLSYEAEGLTGFPEVEELGARAHARDPGAFEGALEALHPDDVALLCTTSGTTSRPKLAMLTHRNLLGMAHQYQQVDPMSPEDDYVSFLPLAWIGEQMLAVSTALAVDSPSTSPSTSRRRRVPSAATSGRSAPSSWFPLHGSGRTWSRTSRSWRRSRTPLKRRAYDWALSVGREAAAAPLRRPSPDPEGASPSSDCRMDGTGSVEGPARSHPGPEGLHGRGGVGPRRVPVLPRAGREPEAALRPDRGGGNLGGPPGRRRAVPDGGRAIAGGRSGDLGRGGDPVPGTLGVPWVLPERGGDRGGPGGRVAPLRRCGILRRAGASGRRGSARRRDEADRWHHLLSPVRREQAQVQPLHPRGGGLRRRGAPLRHRGPRHRFPERRPVGRATSDRIHDVHRPRPEARGLLPHSGPRPRGERRSAGGGPGQALPPLAQGAPRRRRGAHQDAEGPEGVHRVPLLGSHHGPLRARTTL